MASDNMADWHDNALEQCVFATLEGFTRPKNAAFLNTLPEATRKLYIDNMIKAGYEAERILNPSVSIMDAYLK